MEVLKIIAWNVRRLRVERGLTIEALAHQAGTAPRVLGRIERVEDDTNPTLGLLTNIAKVLDVKFLELLVEPPKGAEKPKTMPRGRRPKAQRKASRKSRTA